MNITEEQIRKIASKELDIKDVFPEVFNFTGWAKDDRYKEYLGYFKDNIMKYGIDAHGNWFSVDNDAEYNPNIDHPATHEEIKTALVKEAKKRGFEFDFYDLDNNVLWVNTKEKGSLAAFNKGTWAEVKKSPKYVLVSEKNLYLIRIGIYKGNFIRESNINKKLAIIFESKEKAEAMNVLLEKKYKLEEI